MRLTDLEGNTERSACRILRRLAATVRPPQVIVELGSYKGRTACWMASTTAAQVVCVDAWETGGVQHRERVAAGYSDPTKYTAPGIYDTFRRQTSAYPNIEHVKALTTEPAAGWDRPVGLLYIDADHRYEAVAADFEAWEPHLVAGGWVAFHDYGNPNLGVGRFCDETIVPPAWVDRSVRLWSRRPDRRGLLAARKAP